MFIQVTPIVLYFYNKIYSYKAIRNYIKIYEPYRLYNDPLDLKSIFSNITKDYYEIWPEQL